MNCQDAQSLFYEVIDNEATPIDRQSVKAHLDQCSECQNRFTHEQLLHSATRAKCCQAVQGDCANDRLKASILERLKTADQEMTPERSTTRPPVRIGRYVLAAAAAVVLVASVGYVQWQVTVHNREYLPLETLHFAVDENPENYTRANFASASVDVVHNFDYHLQDAVGDFRLIGSKVDTLDGIPMEQFVYTNSKTKVSVFVAPADKFVKPADLEKAKVVKNGLTYFDHNCRGCHVVYHQEGQAMIITATTDHSIDLLDFVPGRIGI